MGREKAVTCNRNLAELSRVRVWVSSAQRGFGCGPGYGSASRERPWRMLREYRRSSNRNRKVTELKSAEMSEPLEQVAEAESAPDGCSPESPLCGTLCFQHESCMAEMPLSASSVGLSCWAW